MHRVSSGFQTLENNKTTRPVASWFQMFSCVWKPDETLAFVFEIVHQQQFLFLKRNQNYTKLNALYVATKLIKGDTTVMKRIVM